MHHLTDEEIELLLESLDLDEDLLLDEEVELFEDIDWKMLDEIEEEQNKGWEPDVVDFTNIRIRDTF